MKYANLHLHSTYSDGIFNPDELCCRVKNMGYGAIALADHECAAGWTDMRRAAAKYGLEYIDGIEVYALGNGICYHFTGYDFDSTHPQMASYLKERYNEAERNTKLIFDANVKNGNFKDITWSEVEAVVDSGSWICNEHIFAAMVQKGIYTQKDYWDYIKLYRSAKVEGTQVNRYDSKKMISLIRNAGGVPILAHPHRITKFLPELYKEGIMGVEVSHPDITEDDISEAKRFAEKHKLYMSGGTDHTGITGNNMERGDLPGRDAGVFDGSLIPYDTDVRCGIDKEEFEALKNRIYG